MPASEKSATAAAPTRLRRLLGLCILTPVTQRLRPRLAAIVRHFLAHNNLLLLNPRSRFGLDYLVDIERLAEGWNYTIDTFFDVGANIGETALAALRRFPHARVYSFEPHPLTFSTLQQRVGTCPNFCGENIALGDVIGSVDMFEYSASALNSLVPNAPFAVRYRQKGRPIRVPCTTLSSYCQEKGIRRIDVLKIDAEGYDLTVLQGGEQMLASGAIRFVYVEFNDLSPREDATGGALLPIDEFLRDYGFRFIASYNDRIETEGEFFSVSNALFAAPPYSTTVHKGCERVLSRPAADRCPTTDA